MGLRLFGLSFTALFLELMVIRWVPSEVRLVAYYANLMLVSSFLGLGVGAMVASRGWNLFRFFAPLFAANILLLLVVGWATIPTGSGEWRFIDAVAGEGTDKVSLKKFLSYVMLVLIFVLNAVAFIPIGEEIGKQFHRLPALRAYSWDLGGSLGGTLFFGAFSLLHFSPIVGMSLVVLLIIVLSSKKDLAWTIPCYVLALGAIVFVGDKGAWWSPYYFITIAEQDVRQTANPDGTVNREFYLKENPPPAPVNVRTMMDPPIYTVRVNQDFYQMHGSVDPNRYSPDSGLRALADRLISQYSVPYRVSGRMDEVLVLGAGGGMDVQTGIIAGAKRVDAVEIDPVIPRISNQYSSVAPYGNPIYKDKIFLHIDDARSFLQNTTDTWDMVIFGFLDSQALFSYGASLRLDGYTYTIESFRKGYERVREGGLLSVSFYAGRPWMLKKLADMMKQATGKEPIIYFEGWKVVMLAPKGEPANLPPQIVTWVLFPPNWRDFPEFAGGPVDLASDDWPYLYLEKKGIPADYGIVIGILLFVSILSVTALRGTSFGTSDAHFLFMGWGFLLLQTKSIGDCSLYFGTTWFVTTLVITGVLLMVLLANWVAIRFVTNFSPLLYVPLFCSLALLLFVPREVILGYSYAVRLAWTLLIVPLPIFFAGLIFSTTFKDGGNPSALFGSNLMGATIGGFCEYMGMWIGSEALSYIVIAAYIASLTCILMSRKKLLPAAAAA